MVARAIWLGEFNRHGGDALEFRYAPKPEGRGDYLACIVPIKRVMEAMEWPLKIGSAGVLQRKERQLFLVDDRPGELERLLVMWDRYLEERQGPPPVAHQDCPECPKCKGPGIRAAEFHSHPRALYCPACGNEWQGSSEEVKRANRSEAAWRYCNREGLV